MERERTKNKKIMGSDLNVNRPQCESQHDFMWRQILCGENLWGQTLPMRDEKKNKVGDRPRR